jgi:TOMM system kinase/cyclase fusion protein
LVPGSSFVSGYELLGEIGRGSFGRVYRARQLSTQRDVAIKVLRRLDGGSAGDLANQVERFRREMQLSSNLSHPNIVKLIDSGETDEGRLFAVFEFVPGTTLKQVLADEGALGLPETIHLMTQVLDALACAHGRGVVHRDLKPENIMVTRTGARRNALVLDFGLGGFVREAEGWDLPRLTATYELLGTPCYAAPEQLRGESPSPLSDLYAWGLIFLECLTGEVAVGGASAQDVVMRQLGSEPVPIPPWLRKHRLGRLLETVTAKPIERRSITIDALVEALTAVGPGDVLPPRAETLPEPPPRGERRQLTVVCCRLSVSSPRGDIPDVEEADTTLHAWRGIIGDIAARWGGRIATVMADRLLLVFGHPQAREHDARMAARAALRIVEETKGADRQPGEGPLRIQIRAGVHTGLVIIHDPVQRSSPDAINIVGLTPEIAARLEEVARPGEVLVSADVQRLLRGRIGAEPLDDRETHGGVGPVFRLTRDKGPGSDLWTGRYGRETPLIGRSHQLEQLEGRWADTERGSPNVVLVTGEAGIGKTRLVRELRRTIPASSWVECRCLPENQNSPLRPFIDLLTTGGESIETLLRRVGLDLAEYLHLFTALLGIAPDERYPAPQLTPERRKELTFNAIVTLLLRMAADRPLALVIEDIHWADPTTLELIELLVREIEATRTFDRESAGRICVVFTSRPGFVPTWPIESTLVIPLARLSREEVEALVVGMTEGQAPPRPVLDEVVQHADGVPLFVEEVTWMLLESSLFAEPGGPPVAERPGFDIPVTLRDLLASRLDTLSQEARETGQLAAALGRELRYDVLAAVSPREDTLLRGDLRELVDAGLVYHRGRVRPESYFFKHALVRDATYEMMTRPARQEVHARIADTLEKWFPEMARDRPEVVAHHLELAAEMGRAADYWKRSGDHTMSRGAYVESVRHFERGLSLLENLPARKSHVHLELGLLESLGTAKLATQGYASPEVEEAFGRAQRLCDEVGEDVSSRVLHGIWGVLIMRGEREATAKFLPRFRRHAERHGDPVSLMTVHGHTGLWAFFTGDFPRALEEMTTATQWYRTDEYRVFLREYGYDGGLYPFAYRMLSLWILGRPNHAVAARDELLSLAAASGNPYGLAIADSFSALLSIFRGEPGEALERADRLAAHASEQKLFFFLCPAMCAQGWAAVQEGRPDDGIALIQQGLSVFQMIGVRAFYGYYLSLLADAQLARGATAEGLAAVEEGLTLARTSVDCFYEAELRRLQGELLRLEGRTAEAEASFGQALALARKQGARSFELRAATSMGRLLRDRREYESARSVLRGACGQFDEAFQSRDLVQARSLLAEVAAP